MANTDLLARVLRTVAGGIGTGVGVVVWQTLWDSFTTQVGSATLAAVQGSKSFAIMAGLAAVLIILGFAISLACATDWAVRRLGASRRRSVDA